MTPIHRHPRSVAAAFALVTLLVVGISFMSIQDAAPQRASAAGGGAEMILTMPSHNNCDDPDRPTTCTLATGTTFTVSVELLNPPPNGYVYVSAWIDYDDQGLVNKPVPAEGNPVDNRCATGVGDPCVLWPDGLGVLLSINHVAKNGYQAGASTSILPPLPASFHEGDLYSFSFTCTDTPSSSTLQLIGPVPPAGTSGTIIYQFGGGDLVPKLGDLTIECVEVGPGDTDGDGCSDLQEFGNDETLGGRRDYQNPWDFYDVAGWAGGPPDGIIDLANDILGVIQHFAPLGAAPYDIAFDRGRRMPGGDAWDLTAPDGVIDLAHDILGVIWQFNHSCQ